jgi:hypothetical protein
MKKGRPLPALLASFLLFNNCASEAKKLPARPDPAPQQQSEAWQILESENNEAIPEWLKSYLSGGCREVESMGKYQDKYVFIGKMDGNNFSALSQWAAAFSADREMPRLVAMRIEERLVSAASLYPGDEYGDFFELLIKAASNAEYAGLAVEESFWIKRRIETVAPDEDGENNFAAREQYDFYKLTSDDKFRMQNKIRGIIESVKPPVPPTREQSSAISRIKRNFFEEF